ncbi:hypothetical protein [Ktedonosporobacter rubrisoli]|uniref:hypothetical protein n=1 Tax=Ktedonosporobacter rubrisoli TaxID=2509675 RepID=UPI0013EEBAA3|nr:hypothetical protein [Ktedonosporobacter rubrisoli]
MENILLLTDTVMEYVVEPAQKSTRPASWVKVLEHIMQMLKVVALSCQILAWLSLL